MSGAAQGHLKHKIMLGLLLLVPAAVGIRFLAPEQITLLFFVSCLAIIPLASFMGGATEVISVRLGPGLGGMMNAAFGNAAEFILAVAALRAGQLDILKASLTGSIIGNLLLVFGGSALLGGLRRDKQVFNATAARADTTLLFLAVAGLVIPAAFHAVTPKEVGDAKIMTVSIGVSIILLGVYVLGLLFSLKTHSHLYGDDEHHLEEEAPTGKMNRALMVLVAATVGVAIISELIIHTVEHTTAALGFTHTFVGIIVLATVGNAAEHSTAIIVARKDKMALALTICVESSKQIALFVAPLLVLLSLLTAHPMSLEFTQFEVLAVALSVAIIHMVAGDGQTNWLEGAMLLAVYGMLGVAFFFVP